MQYQIEKEYKMLLTENEFNKLISSIKFDSIFDQVNHYYSAPNNMGMRIRVIDDRYTFTLKHYINNELREYEFDIENFDINDIHIQRLFKELNIDKVSYLGSLTTKRYFLDFPKASLVLDASSYFNKLDYELEYELKNASDDDFETLNNLLFNFGINYQANHISKYQRFLNALKEG